MGKPTICIGKNKGADQLCSNCKADQRLCFRYMDSTIPLLSKPERPRCRNHRNRPCKTRKKSKSIITTNVGVNYTFKHSSFRNRLSFQAGSINMHVVCPQSYLGKGIFVNFRQFRAIWDLNKHRAHRGYITIFSHSSPFIDRNR